MLGASSSEYGLELSTDILLRRVRVRKWPETGWNNYYVKTGRKYEELITAKKKAPSPSQPGKRRKVDPTKLYGSHEEVKEQIKAFEKEFINAQSGK